MTDELRDMLAEAMLKALHWNNDDRWPDALLAAFPPEAVQAWRDGLALRRLRKTLPDDRHVKALWVPGPNGWWWEVSVDPGISPPPSPLSRNAFTLAEAADKAREALG